MQLRLSGEAEQDVAEIFAWIHADNPDAADRFLSAFRQELKLLSLHPFIGRRRRFRVRGVRSWRVSGFENYHIFYRPGDAELAVVRVLHGARDLRSIFRGLPSRQA